MNVIKGFSKPYIQPESKVKYEAMIMIMFLYFSKITFSPDQLIFRSFQNNFYTQMKGKHYIIERATLKQFYLL